MNESLENIIQKVISTINLDKEPAATLKQLRNLIHDEHIREQTRMCNEKESFEGYLEDVRYNDGYAFVLVRNGRGKMAYVAYALPEGDDAFYNKIVSLKNQKANVRIYFRKYIPIKDDYQVYYAFPEIDVL